jgi:hypothetical protein
MNATVKKHLLEASQGLANDTAQLCTIVKDSGPQHAHLQSIGRAAKGVNDAMSHLMGALETVEFRGAASSDLDFAKTSGAVTGALSQLREANNNKAKIVQAARLAAMAVNDLVLQSKKVAAAITDPVAKKRLQNYMQEAADSVSNLTNAIREVAANPDDKLAVARMNDAAQKVDTAVQQLVTEAARHGAIQGLRYHTKATAAAALGAEIALYNANKHVTDAAFKVQLDKENQNIDNAAQELITAVTKASKSTEDAQLQRDLLIAVQRNALPLASAVAQIKRLSPGITEPNDNQNVLKTTNDLAEAIQKLMNAAKAVKETAGDERINEALNQIESANAELDILGYASQGDFLLPEAGQTNDGAMQLLQQTLAKLTDARNKLLRAARGEGNLGEAALESSNVLGQQNSSVKAAASTTKDKATQLNTISSAKKLNKDAANLILAARAAASNQTDENLKQALDKASNQVSNSMSSLVAAAQGLNAQELDSAIETITDELGKLRLGAEPVNNNLEFRQAGESINTNTKALFSAVSQLAATARNDPKRLGAIAKMVANTYSALADSANQAAMNSQNRSIHDQIQRSIGKLGETLNTAINISKEVAANKNNQKASSELTEIVSATQTAIDNLLQSAMANSFPEVDAAVSQIQNIANLLDPSAIHTLQADGTFGRAQALGELQRAAQGVANASARLLGAASMGNASKLGLWANEAVSHVDHLRRATAVLANPGAQGGQGQLSGPAQELLNAINTIVNNPHDGQRVVGSAREAATAASKLIEATKKTAGTITEKPKQALLLKAAHGLATATSNMARAAQSALESPENMQQLIETAKELAQRTMELEGIRTKLDSEQNGGQPIPALDPAIATKLVIASRSLAISTGNLVKAATSLAAKGDQQSQDNLSMTTKALSEALRELLETSAVVNPAKQAADKAVKTIAGMVAELDSAAIKIAVGGLDASIANGKTHQQAQEELVQLSRSIANNIDSIVDGAIKEGVNADLAGIIGRVEHNIPMLVSASKIAAVTTSDNQSQKDLLSLTKVRDHTSHFISFAL